MTRVRTATSDSASGTAHEQPPPLPRGDKGGFVVDAICAQNGEAFEVAALSVVLATGGMSLPKTGSDGGGYALAQSLGHSLVPPTPALAPLILEGDFHASLSGVAHEVEVTIRVTGERPFRLDGPMLWTHFGASGPAILDASRHWHHAKRENKEVVVSLSFLPGDDFPTAEQRIIDLAAAGPKTLVRNALLFSRRSGGSPVTISGGDETSMHLPARLIESIVTRLGIYPRLTLGRLTRDDRRRLVHALLDWPLPVLDSRGFTHAEATAGGVPLSEIDPATMASRVCPGLFLVGEILDVDGRIGGFNFQWAWSSAFVASVGLVRGFGPK